MARGTRSPSAIVDAFAHAAARSWPSVNARTIGAQPSAWTDTMRGRRVGAHLVCQRDPVP